MEIEIGTWYNFWTKSTEELIPALPVLKDEKVRYRCICVNIKTQQIYFYWYDNKDGKELKKIKKNFYTKTIMRRFVKYIFDNWDTNR